MGPVCASEFPRRRILNWLAMGVMALSLCVQALGERIVYVSAASRGAHNGTSWTDAYTDLQDALDDVRDNNGCPCEIWIAEGTYKPDRGTGDQRQSFELFGNVALYGGFAGWEDCCEQRNPGVNVSILSGDLNGDDNPDAQPTSDCCVYGYVDHGNQGTCSDAECRAAVVAFDPSCGERWRSGCNQTAVHVCCDLCRPTRCDNTYNVLRATEPGSAPVFDGLDIVDGEGFDPDPQQFYGYAGGLHARLTGPRVTGCRFLRNRPQAASFDGSRGVLDHTSFVENGMEYPSMEAVFFYNSGGALTISHLLVSRNICSGMFIWGGEVTIRDSTFEDNESDGLFCFGANCTVLRCQFVGNTYGGVATTETIWVIDSLFLRNAHQGLFTFYGAIVINSIFAGNTGSFGAGIRAGSAYVLNSVFFGNSADSIGGMAVGDGGATIRNSIFWGNSDDTGFTQHAQFSSNSTTIIHVDHSIVQGWTGVYGGVGNSGVDPMFVDENGADYIGWIEDGDFRLSPGSPAINAGDPNTNYLPPTDLDGHARVLCGRVDIGAYEFGIGDYNCNKIVNLTDFAAWQDCMTGPLLSHEATEPRSHEGTIEYRQSAIGNRQLAIGCEAFDFNGDSAVDLLDFAAFQRIFTAP